MERYLRRVFLAAVLALSFGTAVTLLLVRVDHGRWALALRSLVFSRAAPDSLLIEAAPDALVRAGFREDAGEVLARWRLRFEGDPLAAAILDSARQVPSTAGRVQTLVRLLSRGGYRGGCGGGHDLAAKLGQITAGFGCCSDHTEVFLGLGALVGVTAREVSTPHHTLAEYYDDTAAQWVLIDPTYGIMARDQAGHRLSIAGVRARRAKGALVNFEFFGPAPLRSALNDADFAWFYLDPRAFEELAVTWGNNVFSVGEQAQRWRLLPAPAAALVGLLYGGWPSHRVFYRSGQPAPAWVAPGVRLGLGVALPLLLLCLLCYPVLALARRLLPRGAPSRRRIFP